MLTLENTSKIGKTCRIYNAIGNEVRYVTEANMETGEVERIKLDKNGKIVVDWKRYEVVRERLFVPAPLRVVWMDVETVKE